MRAILILLFVAFALAAAQVTTTYEWILVTGLSCELDSATMTSCAEPREPLPPGLSLAPSGIISGTPTKAGQWVSMVIRKGSDGSKLYKVVSLLVRPKPTDGATVNPVPPSAGVSGAAYNLDLNQ